MMATPKMKRTPRIKTTQIIKRSANTTLDLDCPILAKPYLYDFFSPLVIVLVPVIIIIFVI